jgi:hypothetical protein
MIDSTDVPTSTSTTTTTTAVGSTVGSAVGSAVGSTVGSLRQRLLEHALVLFAYGLLAIALTWPLARNFTTRLVGHVFYDMRHALWIQWYVKEALFGHVTWPDTNLLHYPFGMSTLVDGVGPLNGLMALPFWPWGAAAAFNGASLLGVALSGWCLYLLARHVRLDRSAAFFAGLLFMAWPIHLVGLYGHLEKLFTGLLPLTLLAGLLAFDLKRRWTILAPGPVLLAVLFQNANQFTFGVLGLAVLAVVQLARTPREQWLAQCGRIVVVAAVSLAVCIPALELIASHAYHPLMLVDLGTLSPYYAPDLLQFLVPSINQVVPARWFYVDRTFGFDGTLTPVISALGYSPPHWYGSGIETAVAIPITALLLGIAACWLRDPRTTRREAWRWLILGVAFAVLALGPTLRAAGYTTFTPWQIHVPLPQAWLAKLPGFNVMRTPGRFMMMGSVGFAMAAGVGLMVLTRRAGTRRVWVIAAASALALVECWPAPWPQHVLPPVPAFYQQIANDGQTYGVLDLPAGWLGRSGYSSAYHYYQITHGKPIAWSYLSRFYVRYPIHGFGALWDPAITDYAATRDRVARFGYRYVVWHKHADELFSAPRQDAASETGPLGAPVPAQTDPFLREAFRGEAPVYDDDLVTVYRTSRAR